MKKGRVKGVEGLIEAGADVNKALKSAALHGHDQCVESLIKAGADVNMSCHLVVAVKSGSQRCVAVADPGFSPGGGRQLPKWVC